MIPVEVMDLTAFSWTPRGISGLPPEISVSQPCNAACGGCAAAFYTVQVQGLVKGLACDVVISEN